MGRIIKTTDYEKENEQVTHNVTLNREQLEDLKDCIQNILNEKEGDGDNRYLIIELKEDVNVELCDRVQQLELQLLMRNK